ncbi:MAG: DinB family protein [Proteobacteria bacterium]|nr:DinB family protein [Pseudomonadota bacterium]
MELGVQYFRTFARYNFWANNRLYNAAGELPDEARRLDRKVFFGSLHSTLNHLLAGDRIWMGRILGRDHGVTSLDQILYEEFDELRAERLTEDLGIVTYADGLKPEDMLTVLEYRTFSAGDGKTPLPLVLGHMFNHQTHHRGQAHAMLSQAGLAAPSLDLIYFLREAEDAASTA